MACPESPLAADAAKAVIGETPLLSQIETGLLDFMAADLSYVCGSSLENEEAFKIAYAVGDYSRGVRAFAFSGSAELITMK